MAIDVQKLQVVVGADVTDAERGLDRIDQKTKKFTDTATRMGQTLSLGVTAPLLLVGKAAISGAKDYESSMNMMQAVSGATAKEMKAIGDLSIKLGNDITIPAASAKDAAEGMVELSKAGLSVKDTMDAASGTLRLAAAANVSAAQAAEINANALNAFGLAGDQATRVADLLAAAAASSSGEVTDMADALKMGSAVFNAAGFQIEDLVAAIGQMANAGIMGSDAGTSLKQMILSLQAPALPATKQLRKFGIEIYNSAGQMNSFKDIIGQFSTKLAGATEEERNYALAKIFGSDAVRAANIVMMGGVAAHEKMFKAVTKQGAAADLAAARMKGLNGAYEAIKNSTETFMLTRAMPLLGSLAAIGFGFSDLVNRVGELPDPLLNGAAAFLAVMAAAGPVLLGISGLAIAIGFVLSPIGLLVLAVGGFAAALAASPPLLASVQSGLMTVLPWVQAFSQALASRVIDLAMSQYRFFANTILPLLAAILGPVVSLMTHFSDATGGAQHSAMLAGDAVGYLVSGFLALQAVRIVNGLLAGTATQFRAVATSAQAAQTRGVESVQRIEAALQKARLEASLLSTRLGLLWLSIQEGATAAKTAIQSMANTLAGIVSKAITVTANVVTSGLEKLDVLKNRTIEITANVKVPAPQFDVTSVATNIGKGLAQGVGVAFGAVLAPLILANLGIAMFAGIGLLIIGGIILAIKNPEEAGKIAGAIVGTLASAATLVVGGLAFVAVTIGQALVDTIVSAVAMVGDMKDTIATALGDILREAVDLGLDVATEVFITWPSEILKAIQEELGPPAARLIHEILEGDWAGAVEAGLDLLQALFGRLPERILGIISEGLGRIGKRFDEFFADVKRITQTAFEDLGRRWGAFKDDLSRIFGELVSKVQSELSSWMGKFGKGFKEGLDGAIQKINDFTNDAVAKFWAFFGDVGEVFANIRNDIGQKMGEAKDNAINRAIELKDGAWSRIEQLRRSLSDLGAGIKSALLWPFEQGRDAIGGILTSFKNNAARPIRSAAAGINSFVGGLAHAIWWVGDQLGLSGLIGDVGGHLINIQGFAAGGVAPGGPIFAGERGTELIMPPAGSRIFNARETIEIFKAVNQGRHPEGSPLQPDGRPLGMGGVLDTIGGTIKGVTGALASKIRGVLDKGVDVLIGSALGGLSLDAGGGRLGDIGGAVFDKLIDAATGFIKEVFQRVKDAMPAEAMGVGGVPSNYPGGNAILDMAIQTKGWYLYCERFIGDVMQRLGLRYYRAASAIEHAGMQPLNPGFGPAGAITYFPWDTYGHVGFSGGDGSIFGTMNNAAGTGWSRPGTTPLGWTVNPYATGGFFEANNPKLGLIGEGRDAEVLSPEPVLRRILKQEFAGSMEQFIGTIRQILKFLGFDVEAVGGNVQKVDRSIQVADASIQLVNTGVASVGTGVIETNSTLIGLGGGIDEGFWGLNGSVNGVEQAIGKASQTNDELIGNMANTLDGAAAGSGVLHVWVDNIHELASAIGGSGAGIGSPPPNAGLVQAEDGSWVPANYWDNHAGMVLTEDGTWVPASFYDSDVITGDLTPGMGAMLPGGANNPIPLTPTNPDVVQGGLNPTTSLLAPKPAMESGQSGNFGAMQADMQAVHDDDVISGPVYQFAGGGFFRRPRLAYLAEGPDPEVAAAEPELRRIFRDELGKGGGLAESIVLNFYNATINARNEQEGRNAGRQFATGVLETLRQKGQR